jgi:hypothetical protein
MFLEFLCRGQGEPLQNSFAARILLCGRQKEMNEAMV